MSEQDRTTNVSPAHGVLDEATAYAALSTMLLADRPLGEVLDEVARRAKRVLPETSEVSVTLLKGDHAETAASTGAVALQLDERQYDKRLGPCLDAAVSGAKIKLTMADPDSPYPDWRQIARQQGVTHTLSIGFPVATQTVGALNVYNSTGRPFSPDSERIVATFANFARIVLTSAGLHQNLADLAAQLEAAVRSRAVIDQAKGMIMTKNRCTAEEAFQVLVRTSQNRNLKLRYVAEELVQSVAQPVPGANGTGPPPRLR
jgi:transcriptional regulator with GAF, ATPase, and Fis domain